MIIMAALRRARFWKAVGLVLLAAVAALGASAWIWRHELEPLAERLGVHWFESEAEHDAHGDHKSPAKDAATTDDHDHAAHADGDTDDDDDHDHAAETAQKSADGHVHTEADSLKLGKEAQKNIGLSLTTVRLGAFDRTVAIPGIVVERPGWTTLEVTAPMTGVVTRIHPIQGEAVEPGQPLFEVRLTHEDLLQKQTEFLRNLEQRDCIIQEVARLEKAAGDGVVAGKTFLERKYEQQKQEATLRAERQALLLHGLSARQIDEIDKTRTLLKELTVVAPSREGASTAGKPSAPAAAGAPQRYRIQEIKVSQGSYVTAGATLARLVDHATLYIEGKAFEQDVGPIHEAASRRRPVSAVFGARTGGNDETVSDLAFLYMDDKVDADSRTYRFYVTLPNRVMREDRGPDGRRFLYWKYTPGARVQIHVPLETWPDRIVLPAEAVAQEGADYYVFEWNGDHFDRRAVHVEYRDSRWVVIAAGDSLRPGVKVAASAAHQMQMALKNKSAGEVDPHAGHNH